MQSSQLREIADVLDSFDTEDKSQPVEDAREIAASLRALAAKQDEQDFPNGMLFEAALYAIKAGRRLTRAGWEDKSMVVMLHVPPLMIGDEKMTEPYLYLKVGDYATPWCPGQGDLMANDWMLVR